MPGRLLALVSPDGKVSTAPLQKTSGAGTREGVKHTPFATILEPFSVRCSGLPGSWRSN